VKRALPLALAVLALVAARPPEAGADTPKPPPPPAGAAASRISFKESPELDALPLAAPFELRTPEVPKRIEAREQVQAFWSGKPTWHIPAEKASPAPKKRGRKATKKAPRHGASPAQPDLALVAPTPLAAIASERTAPRVSALENDREGRDVTSHDVCFSPAQGKVPTRDAVVDFETGSESVLLISPETGPGVSPSYPGTLGYRSTFPLHIVRAEKLGTGPDGKATLSITHAWVDERSGGARLIQTRQIALQPIQETPGGLEVFAYRIGDRAIFVVQHQPLVPERISPATLEVTHSPGSIESTYCHHVTVPLDVGKVGEAETVTVSGEMALKVVLPAEGEGEERSELKLRAFRLSLSETWLSGDARPVLSASFAWTGKLHGEDGSGER
jgi:hypothetical protein